MKSSKKYISEYICLKILKGSYITGDIIYSENKLAIKFNCSRLTARSALIQLVNAGILVAKRGKGYIVSSIALNILFYGKRLYLLGNNHKFFKLDNSCCKFFLDFEKGEYDVFAIKTFKDNELLSVSYIFLNKIFFKDFINAGYDFLNETIEKIINTGFIPNSIENAFEIKEMFREFEEDKKSLGYNCDFVPLIKQTMITNENEIAFICYSVSSKSKNVFSIHSSILIN